jgi:hypothetical protein
MTQTIAYSYLRLSTKIQLKGDGKRRQLDDTHEAAEKHGWTLSDKTFHDLGVSAFKGDNLITGALSQFLKLVEEGTVARGSVLMVENPDRISREGVTKSVTILMTLLAADIMVYTTADHKLYSGSKETAFLDLITWGIAAERGHDESLRKSERISKAKKAQRERARATGYIYSVLCPHWLRVVGKGDARKFELVPDRVEIIQLIYKKRLEGWSLYDLAIYLTKEGYTPTTSINNRDSAKIWHVAALQRWLTSTAVIGEFQPVTTGTGKRLKDGDPIPNYYPAIISEQDFRRVAGTFREGTKGRVPHELGANIFRGLLVCSCGSNLHVTVRHSPSTHQGVPIKLKYRKITCPNNKLKTCGITAQHYHAVEGFILASLRNIEWGSLIKGKEHADKSALESLRKSSVIQKDTLVELDKQLGNIVSSIATVGINVHLQELLTTLTLKHADTTKDLKATLQSYEDLKSIKDSQATTSLSISQTINAIINQATEGETRVRMNNMLTQHISKILFTDKPHMIQIYDTQGILVATIQLLDKKLTHARIVTPQLEWEVEQHFNTNSIAI